MVVQYAEKFEVFKRQTQSQRELVDSAILQLHRSLEALGSAHQGSKKLRHRKTRRTVQLNPTQMGIKHFSQCG